MTVKDLRTLVDNLEEYIHVPGGIERLKKTILHLAVSGKLVPQDPSEGTGEELYKQIQAEKQKLIQEGKLKKQKLLPEVTDEEILFEIPKTWKWVRLGTVAEIISSKRIHERDYVSVGVPFYRSKEIGELSLGKAIKNRLFISEVQYTNIKNSFGAPTKGDLLITSVGSIGNAWISDGREFYYKDGNITQIPKNKYLDPSFLLTFIKSSLFKSQAIGTVSGTAYNALTIVKFKNILLPLIPITHQKRIVEKVDTIFALIDELAEKYAAEQKEREKLVGSSLAHSAKGDGSLALNHLTEIVKTKSDASQLRKTILHLAVSGQLVPQDPSEGTGEDLYQQIQAEKATLVKEGKLKKQKPLPEITPEETPFQIPKTWKWVHLHDLSWLEQGKKVSNVEYNNLDAKYLRGKKEPQKKTSGFLIEKDQRVILVDGENSGEVFIVSETGYLGSTFKKLGMSKNVNIEYLDIILVNLKEEMRQNKIGAAIPHLDKKLFREKPTALPPLAEQTRIVQKTTQLLDLVTKLEIQLQN
jgi:type I restriction enzyme S subunit